MSFIRRVIASGVDALGVERIIRTDPSGRIIQAVDSSGVDRVLRSDAAGRLKQSLGQPDPVSGNLAATGDVVAMAVDGFSSITAFLGGSFSGATVVAEQSPDATSGTTGTWFPLSLANASSGATSSTPLSNSSTNTAANGVAPGAAWVRLRATTTPTTGPVAARLVASSSSVSPGVGVVVSSGAVVATPTSPSTSSYELGASVSSTLVTSAANTLAELTISNPTVATVYLKLYNKSSAPAIGTDTPLMTIPVPSGGFESRSFGPTGKRLSAGLGFGVTTMVGKADQTAPAAGVQLSISRV